MVLKKMLKIIWGLILILLLPAGVYFWYMLFTIPYELSFDIPDDAPANKNPTIQKKDGVTHKAINEQKMYLASEIRGYYIKEHKMPSTFEEIKKYQEKIYESPQPRFFEVLFSELTRNTIVIERKLISPNLYRIEFKDKSYCESELYSRGYVLTCIRKDWKESQGAFIIDTVASGFVKEDYDNY